MIHFLKKYWFLIIILLVLINILGVHFMGKSIDTADTLEHAESDEMISALKLKDFFYRTIVYIILIIDLLSFIFLIYNGMKIILNLKKRHKI